MKNKILSLFTAVSVAVCSMVCGTAYAEKDAEAERIISPSAVVYTHWGDEEQTNQKYNYNYVLWSLGDHNTSGSQYWAQPERVLFYRFDLSQYISEGYDIEKAVLLQQGPSSKKIALFDCPDNNLENGMNYSQVPSLALNNRFFVGDLKDLCIGTDTVQSAYSGARSNDNMAIDVTDYVNGKIGSGNREFTYAMYPFYGNGTQIYFNNHAQLYVKLKKARENIVFLHANSSQQLSISGETGEDSVSVTVTDPSGSTVYTNSKTLGEREAYYHFTVDMSEMSSGEYTVRAVFGTAVVTKKFNFVQNLDEAGTIYTSVDYGTGTVRVYGKANQEKDDPVMLTILNPGYSSENIDYSTLSEDAVCHSDIQTTNAGHYDFKVGMSDTEGTFTAVVQSVRGESKTVFTYYPSDAGKIDNELDKYTTTKYAPWIVNWHMTKQNQLDAGYYGGEACQMSWALEISPTNSNLMFAGTDTNCLWKSTDGGKSWRSSSAGFNSMGVADIAVDPENENIVYALGSTGGGKYDRPYTGIYKSTDCGETWTRIFDNSYYRKRNNSIIRFGKRGADGVRRIFVGGHGYGAGLVYSDDEGATWHQAAGGTLAEYVTRDIVIFENDVRGAEGSRNVLFATDHGIFLSTDYGDTVTERDKQSDISYTVTVDPRNEEHWICGYDDELYESYDMGQSWTFLNYFGGEAPSRSIWVSSIKYGYGDTPRLYVCYGPMHYPVRYSDNDGKIFTAPSKAADSTEFIKDNYGWGAEPYELDPQNPNVVIASFDGELYKSEDGGETYTASSSGYSGMRASDFLFDSSDDRNIFITSIDRGVVKTVDSGRGEDYPIVDYDPSEDGTGIRYSGSKTMSAVARDPKNSQRIIVCVGGSQYILKQSYDGGESYTPISGTENCGYIRTLEFNRDNMRTIYAGDLVSYDDGETWTSSDVTILAVSPFDGNTVYGIMDGRVAKSTDEGRTWTKYGPSAGGVQVMKADLFEKDVLYIGTYSALIRIEADGAPKYITPTTKTDKEGRGFYGLAFAQDPKNRLHMVTGGTDNLTYGQSGGIFESYDGGETWQRINGMPASRDIWVMEFHPNLPRVYIGTSAGTFVYEYEKYTDEKIAVTNKTISQTQREGEDNIYDIDYSFELWNTQDSAIDATVVLTACEKYTDKLLNTVSVNYSLKPTSKTDVSIPIEMRGNTVLKAFIWTDKLTPIKEKYDWTVIANDPDDATNIPPTIGAVNVTDSAYSDEEITVSAEAADSDGSIERVEVRVDGSMVGNAAETDGVYSLNIGKLAAGLHTIRLTAYDNVGASAYSEKVIEITDRPVKTETMTIDTKMLAQIQYGNEDVNSADGNGNYWISGSKELPYGKAMAYKFDISSLSDIEIKKVELLSKGYIAQANIFAYLHDIYSNDWESGINYTGLPKYSTETAATASPSYAPSLSENGYDVDSGYTMAFDITDLVKSKIVGDDTEMSLLMRLSGTGSLCLHNHKGLPLLYIIYKTAE